jgi:hypothetical protein
MPDNLAEEKLAMLKKQLDLVRREEMELKQTVSTLREQLNLETTKHQATLQENEKKEEEVHSYHLK